MKYLDLFTGIGGFTNAIENAGNGNNEKKKPEQSCLSHTRDCAISASCDGDSGGESPACCGFSEIDKHATAIYKFHYPNHKNYGDITAIDPAELPDFDLLAGGFPCQSFSIAGKRRGFDDTRGTLFFDVARILRYKKPKYLLLENVKGLLSHDGGSTFSTIIETLQEIGYGVSWKVLNTKDFGIPQNRERVFIFGVRGECPREILPLRESNEKGDERNKRKIRVINQQTRSKDRPSLKYSSGGSGTLCKNDEAFCLPAGGGGGQYIQKENNRRIRRLTPRECERLQGFEDSWTKFGNYDGKIKEVSDTQRYKVLGNAITVKVAEAVIRQMCQ